MCCQSLNISYMGWVCFILHAVDGSEILHQLIVVNVLWFTMGFSSILPVVVSDVFHPSTVGDPCNYIFSRKLTWQAGKPNREWRCISYKKMPSFQLVMLVFGGCIHIHWHHNNHITGFLPWSKDTLREPPILEGLGQISEPSTVRDPYENQTFHLPSLALLSWSRPPVPKSRLRDPKEKAGDFFDGFGIKRRGTNTTKSCASKDISFFFCKHRLLFLEMKSLGFFWRFFPW